MGSGKIIEGVWDCKYCKTIRILGRHRECPHCGKPRDSDTRFYMTDKKMYVPEEKAKTISRNPDWLCRFCDCLNPDTSNTCLSCGASRTSENLNYFENQKERDQQKKAEPVSSKEPIPVIEPPRDENPESEPVHNEPEQEPDPPYVPPIIEKQEDKQEEHIPTFFEISKNIVGNVAETVQDIISESLPIIGVIALIAIIIGGVCWLASSRTKTVTVDHTYWENTIEIEQMRTVKESDWTLPIGARQTDVKSEIYKYEPVFDHYEDKTRQVQKERVVGHEDVVVGYKDLGNGYFEEVTEQVDITEVYYETEHYQEKVYRDEPVYRDKYYYEIDRWFYSRSLTASGIDSEPYEPDTSGLKSDERTSTRKSSYTFSGTDEEGVTETYEASYSDWTDLKAGDYITIKVSIFGNVRSIEYNNKEE
ncbi:MAG: hypothetical protein IKE91_07930 [Clostridia bacterium]|nr:hypothetical protein [Clostridia bacterium]